MNEEFLKEQISIYKLQLQRVLSSLKSTPYDSDLIQLRNNLTELIQLSEESLLANEKNRLVQTISNNSTSTKKDENPDFEAEWALFQAEVVADSPTGEDSPEECKSLSDQLNSLINSTCQAPFSRSWGELNYYNAIISDVSVDDDIISLEDVQVSVVFCNPVCTAMQPCPFYLEGRCNHKNCRFSHGHMVKLIDLRPFKDPDYRLLGRDSACLVKHSDGLWYKAEIHKIDDDDKFVIKFDNYDDYVSVNLEDIFPLESKNEDKSNDSETSDDEEDADDIQDVIDENTFVPWALPVKVGSAIGDWEAHTKGIGSKLLQRMGYVAGHGLGKNLEGRLEPVEAVVLPPGKSLDKIMELKEHNKLKAPGSSEHHKDSKNKSKDSQKNPHKKTIFDFINSHLGEKQKKLFPHSKMQQRENLKVASNMGLNVQLLKVHEEIKNANKELNQLSTAFERNKERDKKVAGQLSEKIAVLQTHLNELQQKEKTITREQQMRTNKQKLSVF